ncbi:MAG: sigma-70 family RNA polymerase sigma factor [Bacteroidetes bacterium]|nr:sigma-70 family RNA polymerase sigma factor [Bacteroidota bacterium]
MWLFKKRDFATDEELALNYFNTGDKELVGLLFEKHVKTVFGVCLFYFRDKDIAKDAVMQIFEKLITELKKTEVKNFKGWLSFVVRNYCISEIRKNKNKYRLPESYLDFEVNETSFEEEERILGISDEVMLDHMQASLIELKENQRVCVDLFYLKAQSYQQICDKTSFSLNEVKSFIQNGKRNLKLLIENKIKNKKNAG